MKKGLGFEMVVLERINSNLESAFESRAISADMEINTFNGGHDYLV